MTDQAVNYYELKTQLAELGFKEPEVADKLRVIITDEDFHSAILHTRQNGIKFEIELDRNRTGSYEALFYTAHFENDRKLAYEYFKMDIPAITAITQLIDNSKNHKIMYTENLSYLQKQLLNLGFGEQMNQALEKQIQAKLPEFTLDASNTYNKQDVGYTLHFKAGDQNEMYFFNKYEAKLDGKQQTFYINQGSGITAKEAYNLMDGRAVYKELENREGEKYKAWIILDKDNKAENGDLKLKTYSEGWNYKPERAIDKMDIVGINDEGAREKLMRSLEKGNRHQVEAVRDGKPVKVFLEANPAEHLVNITNYKGEPQKLDHYKKAELKPAAKQTETQQQDASKKKTRGKKVSV